MIAIMSVELIMTLQASGGLERSFGGGAYLFHRGDPVRSLFLILEGTIDLLRRQESGNALTVQRAGAGNILAEASIFSDTYHCDGVVAEASRVLSVSKGEFRQRLRDDPGLAELWTAYLARQVQQARFRCEVLALRTVAERLDMWLAWQDRALPPRGEWSAVAREINVSSEALYRELAKRRRA